MKKRPLLAPVSLLAAALLFFATLPYADMFYLGLLHAFAEASMIGGLADWFAVVALFRHPLGIPIPHTAILPRHREKLSQGIIDMVQNSWLNKDTIQQRIGDWHITGKLLTAIDDPDNRSALEGTLRSALRGIVRNVDTDALTRSAVGLFQRQVSDADLLRWMRSAGELGLRRNWHHILVNQSLTSITEWMSSERVRSVIMDNLKKVAEDYSDSSLRRLGKWMAESVNVLNYDDLARSIILTLQDDLKAILHDPEHGARKDFESWLVGQIEGLDDNPQAKEYIRQWRKDILESGTLRSLLAGPAARLRDWLLEDLESPDSVVMNKLMALMDDSLRRLRSDPDATAAADRWLRERLASLIEEHHGEIGKLVKHNLEKLDDEQLVTQIEDKVGADLQYIRLNGAIVGGLVGAIIYLAKAAFAG